MHFTQYSCDKAHTSLYTHLTTHNPLKPCFHDCTYTHQHAVRASIDFQCKHKPTRPVGTWFLTPVHGANHVHNSAVRQEIVHFNVSSTVEQQSKRWVSAEARGGEAGEGGEGGEGERRGKHLLVFELGREPWSDVVGDVELTLPL